MSTRKILSKVNSLITVKSTVRVGLVLLLLVTAFAGHVEFRSTQALAQETMAALKQQCISYNKLTASDRTKSLYWLSDLMLDFRGHLTEDAELRSDKGLEAYVDSTRITGIALLDGELKLEASGYTRQYRDSQGAVFQSSQFADILESPQKIYTARVLVDDEYYDVCAMARVDGPGILIGIYQQPPGLISNTKSDLESLLSGLQLERDGHYVIAGNGTVQVTSEGVGSDPTEANDTFLTTLSKIPKDNALHFFYGNGQHRWGIHSGCEQYSIYIYYPLFALLSAYASTVAIFATTYSVVCLLYFALRNQTLYENHERLRKSNEELKIANNAKTEFLRRISHDIRTPINGIQGSINMAQKHPEDADLQTRCRGNIEASLHILLELVNSILDMGDLESSETVLEEKPFDLTELLNHINAALLPIATEKNVHYEVLRKGTLPVTNLIGSPRYLSQIIMNLTSNAVKYTKSGGYVRVNTHLVSRTADTVTYAFVCEDNGVGMSEAFQQHMYEPFAQETSSARTTYEGTGLGLSIVKKLVDAMGGTITCKSEKNVGTTFRVELTFKIDPAENQAVSESAGESNTAFGNMRVLLVEDNELNMEIAECILEECGTTAVRAWNGKEAVEIFWASSPAYFDLILMDIMMPEMGGREATRTIRALDRSDAKNVPIVAVSANSLQEDIQKNRDAGMNAHIAKPIEYAKLKEILLQYAPQKDAEEGK